jgi:exosortase/archaeosortase family protein
VADGTTFQSSGQFGIIVVGICSVFNSASIAFLACAAFAQHLKPGLRWRDGVVLAVVLLTMIAINTFRLAILGWGQSYFEFWHNGEGNTVIAIVQTLVIATVAFIGARWSIRKSH